MAIRSYGACRGKRSLSWARLMRLARLHYPSPVAMARAALVAGIACAVLDPTLARCTARRRECGGRGIQLSNKAASFTRMFWPSLRQRYDLSDREVWRVQDSSNRAIIEYRGTGARVRCIGSDPSAKPTALRPFFSLAGRARPMGYRKIRTDACGNSHRTG